MKKTITMKELLVASVALVVASVMDANAMRGSRSNSTQSGQNVNNKNGWKLHEGGYWEKNGQRVSNASPVNSRSSHASAQHIGSSVQPLSAASPFKHPSRSINNAPPTYDKYAEENTGFRSSGESAQSVAVKPFSEGEIMEACGNNDFVAIRDIIKRMPDAALLHNSSCAVNLTFRIIDKDNKKSNGENVMLDMSLLTFAAYRGNAETVRLLLSKKADLFERCYNGFTALMAASTKGHTDVIKILLNEKPVIDPSAVDKYGNTPISLARDNGHNDAVIILEDKIRDLKNKRIEWRRSKKVSILSHTESAGAQLIKACEEGNDIEIQNILDSGIDPNIVVDENDGSTALMHAVANNRTNALICLLDNGANPNKRDDTETTPLIYAATSNDLEMVKLLIGAEADPRGGLDYGKVDSDISDILRGAEERYRAKKQR